MPRTTPLLILDLFGPSAAILLFGIPFATALAGALLPFYLTRRRPRWLPVALPASVGAYGLGAILGLLLALQINRALGYQLLQNTVGPDSPAVLTGVLAVYELGPIVLPLLFVWHRWKTKSPKDFSFGLFS